MLPQQDSATGRGIKTAIQAMIGLSAGLVIAVWAVPGVPHVVLNYVQTNLIQVLLTVGIPSGVTAFLWNAIRKDVEKY